MTKGQEALEELKSFTLVTYDDEGNEEDCITLEQYDETMFYDIEKELKALDIIKKREIDVKDITDTTDDYELYVAYCEGKGYAEDYICSQDEFKLLREVFENEEDIFNCV